MCLNDKSGFIYTIPSKICILIGVAVIKKDIVAYPIAAPTTA